MNFFKYSYNEFSSKALILFLWMYKTFEFIGFIILTISFIFVYNWLIILVLCVCLKCQSAEWYLILSTSSFCWRNEMKSISRDPLQTYWYYLLCSICFILSTRSVFLDYRLYQQHTQKMYTHISYGFGKFIRMNSVITLKRCKIGIHDI